MKVCQLFKVVNNLCFLLISLLPGLSSTPSHSSRSFTLKQPFLVPLPFTTPLYQIFFGDEIDFHRSWYCHLLAIFVLADFGGLFRLDSSLRSCHCTRSQQRSCSTCVSSTKCYLQSQHIISEGRWRRQDGQEGCTYVTFSVFYKLSVFCTRIFCTCFTIPRG